MKRLALCCVSILLGVALLALGFSQLNQYITTTSALGSSLSQYSDAAIDSQLATLGVAAEEATQYKAQMTGVRDAAFAALSSLTFTIVLDFVLGLLLAGLGVFFMPKHCK